MRESPTNYILLGAFTLAEAVLVPGTQLVEWSMEDQHDPQLLECGRSYQYEYHLYLDPLTEVIDFEH